MPTRRKTNRDMNYQKTYILGSGHFGFRAFSFLQRRFQTADLLAVDHRPGQLERVLVDSGRAIAMDAISFFSP